MKAVVAAFNQEKALGGAFFVIVQLHRCIDLRHYADQMGWMVLCVAESVIAAARGTVCGNQRQPNHVAEVIMISPKVWC